MLRPSSRLRTAWSSPTSWTVSCSSRMRSRARRRASPNRDARSNRSVAGSSEDSSTGCRALGVRAATAEPTTVGVVCLPGGCSGETTGRWTAFPRIVGNPPTPDPRRACIRRRHGYVDGRDDVVVVEKSTVPAGTADRVRTTLQREGKGLRFHMASNPEFLREGMAIHDALEPDRIVVGVESARGLDVLRRLYAPLLEAGAPLIVTDIRTAELAKHASNAFLALKISFANALARVCERADADVTTVADI